MSSAEWNRCSPFQLGLLAAVDNMWCQLAFATMAHRCCKASRLSTAEQTRALLVHTPNRIASARKTFLDASWRTRQLLEDPEKWSPANSVLTGCHPVLRVAYPVSSKHSMELGALTLTREESLPDLILSSCSNWLLMEGRSCCFYSGSLSWVYLSIYLYLINSVTLWNIIFLSKRNVCPWKLLNISPIICQKG